MKSPIFLLISSWVRIFMEMSLQYASLIKFLNGTISESACVFSPLLS